MSHGPSLWSRGTSNSYTWHQLPGGLGKSLAQRALQLLPKLNAHPYS